MGKGKKKIIPLFNMHFKRIFSFFILLLLVCCKPQLQTNPSGLDWHYMLDTYKVLYTNIVNYGNKTKRYVETIHYDNGKIDSNYLSGTMVDWKCYIEPFLKINMHDTAFQGVYTMSQNIDTLTNNVEITYKPVYLNLPVQNMVVLLDTKSSEIKKIYAQVQYVGAFSKKNETLLYVPGQVIEIITEENPLFSKSTKNAKQLFFVLNNQPKVEIVNGNNH